MSDQAIFARAQPESVRLTEVYRYSQELSRNPSIKTGQAPRGQIKIVVPYDGHQYFTVQACKDVEHQRATHPDQNALIGHLLLTNYGRTNLKDALALSNRYGSVPIHIPVTSHDLADSNRLREDRFACVTTQDYLPRWPDVIPVHVDMQLLDEDMLDLPRDEALTEIGTDVADQIAQQVSFRRNLLLMIQIRLDLPREFARGLNPRITRVSLGWPTITSLRNLHLLVEPEPDQTELPLRYNPSTRSLEWEDIAMEAEEGQVDVDIRTYVSRDMLLLIDQPGELYKQDALNGFVEVEIPGQLLSGTLCRIYGGTGKLLENLVPEVTTRVISNLSLVLGDAFAQRTRSPYQHLHFDEIIPEKMRIADIKTALADRGFRIQAEVPLLFDRDELKHFIWAQRSEGRGNMNFWIFVEGSRYRTERQTQVPGGQTYKSTFDSGEIKVYIRGELLGDSQSLVKEMNALQIALHDRFERLRAKR